MQTTGTKPFSNFTVGRSRHTYRVACAQRWDANIGAAPMAKGLTITKVGRAAHQVQVEDLNSS